MTSPLTLQSLPLFPLGTVLFPGGALSLRIFEVRYLDMISKCHRADAPFGVVALTAGSEVRRPGQSESFADTGTLAVIDHLEAPQAGLLNIRVSGLQRFRITAREQLRHGLWIADVERLPQDQDVPVPPDLQDTAESLRKVLLALQARGGEMPAVPAQPWALDDCGWVANRWCELLPLPPELRQRLMSLDNPLVRLELVSDVLTRTRISSG